MIGMISGQVQYLNAPIACILTSNGVGYEIELPIPSFCQLTIGAQTAVYVHHHVRQDAINLFGFMTRHERNILRNLTKIKGEGGNFGFKEKEAQVAIKNAQSDAKNNTSDLLKAALRQLSGF